MTQTAAFFEESGQLKDLLDREISVQIKCKDLEKVLVPQGRPSIHASVEPIVNDSV